MIRLPMGDGARVPFCWARAARTGLTFRPVVDADRPFLSALYASTRTEELAVTPWSDAQKAAFLDQQFQAQHAHYQKYHPNADRLVIEQAGHDIGRLYIERSASEHGIIDIALLPAHRGNGLGAALLSDIIDEAGAAGKAVSIHVEKNNPARRLYIRLGFIVAEDRGVYDLMIHSPARSASR